jgi:hypothetical protein
MAEGTRVSQLAEALTKLRDECKAENQEVSQMSEAFNKHQADFSKHQTETKEFQTKTEESLHAILETLTTIAPDYVPPNKILVHGETSGEKTPFIPSGETSGEKIPFIPLATEGGGINPRSVNLDFPKFDGTDPTNWVLKAQQFFSFGQIPDNQRVPIAYFHMEGKALQWYNWLMESGSIRSWEEFVVALKIRFEPSAYDDPAGAFTKLQQISTVDEYQSQFEVLSNRIPGLTEEFRVSSFVSGLKEEVRIMVTMLKPTSLPAAFGLARLQEQEVCRRNRSPKPQDWPSNSSYPRLPPAPNITEPSTNQNLPATYTQTQAETLTFLIPTVLTKSRTCPLGGYPPVKCKREERKGFAIIVMKNISLGIGVISPNCTCLKELNGRKREKRWRKGCWKFKGSRHKVIWKLFNLDFQTLRARSFEEQACVMALSCS